MVFLGGLGTAVKRFLKEMAQPADQKLLQEMLLSQEQVCPACHPNPFLCGTSVGPALSASWDLMEKSLLSSRTDSRPHLRDGQVSGKHLRQGEAAAVVSKGVEVMGKRWLSPGPDLGHLR
jgi:hypothetical protein